MFPVIFCLHHAGGSGALFAQWQQYFGQNSDQPAEVVPVTLPGRVGTDEDRCRDMAEAVSYVASVVRRHAVDRDYVLFGHSMGALVAYETARAAQTDGPGGLKDPVGLFVSGLEAPHTLERQVRRDLLGDSQLVDSLVRAGSLSEAEAEDDLFKLFLPQIRGDLRIVDTYRWRDSPKLTTKTWVYHAQDDYMTADCGINRWSELIENLVVVRAFPGGHFYLRNSAVVCQAIDHDLRSLHSIQNSAA